MSGRQLVKKFIESVLAELRQAADLPGEFQIGGIVES